MTQTVLVAGLGTLGRQVLRELTTLPDVEVVAGDVDGENGLRTARFMEILSNHHGRYPDVTFESLDLSDVDDIRETIEAHQPDLVFQAATPLSNRVFDRLPDEVSEEIYGQVGMGWLAPMHLQFPINVARAMQDAGVFGETRYVNASIPDLTNVVMAKQGMAPDCGIGNVGIFAPVLEWAAAKRLGEPARDVTVYAAMPHGVATKLWHDTSTQGMDYYLKVLLRDRDVTDEVDPDHQLRDEGWPEIPDLVESFEESRPIVAANAINIIRGLLHGTGEIVHGPAPEGLVGGWPFRVSGDGAAVVLPDGADREELIEINRAGMALDGVERIEDDGTVVYTDESHRILQEAVGYDCKALSPDEYDEREAEIRGIFDDLLAKYA